MCLLQLRSGDWEKIHCLQVWGIRATTQRYQRFVIICSTDNLCKSLFQWAWNWPWLFVGPQFLSPYRPCEVFRVTLTPKPAFMSYVYVHVPVALHATIVYFYLTCHHCLLFSHMSPLSTFACFYLLCFRDAMPGFTLSTTSVVFGFCLCLCLREAFYILKCMLAVLLTIMRLELKQYSNTTYCLCWNVSCMGHVMQPGFYLHHVSALSQSPCTAHVWTTVQARVSEYYIWHALDSAQRQQKILKDFFFFFWSGADMKFWRQRG